MRCRHCGAGQLHAFLDLGFAPHSNRYLKSSELREVEKTYPLKVDVCEVCWLVQTEDYASSSELFREDYAYFSGTSSTWCAHAATYAGRMIRERKLNKNSFVIEIASNDGYLLKNFVAADIPCLGIEPTASTAAEAERQGIPVLRDFFTESMGLDLATQGRSADLIAANNVLAHVPDINDFVRGMKAALKPEGVITVEFPHLMKLIEFKQFDTVYHEHFSYLSLFTVERIFAQAGLRVFNVEELTTHGGSLRVYACHVQSDMRTVPAVEAMNAEEGQHGLRSLRTYSEFQGKANRAKDELLIFLLEAKRAGKKVAAYGAAAKGNTLLNYAGIKPDLIPFVCDAAISKQGKFMPGSHIPICVPDRLRQYKPDYVLVLPWNLIDEVVTSLADLREFGAKFVTAIPDLKTQ
jgi:SAM-dependent methyltransferase